MRATYTLSLTLDKQLDIGLMTHQTVLETGLIR